MSLLVYAITDAEQVDGSGMDGRPLSLVRSSRVGAVVTHLTALPALAGERRMWEYERVVEGLMDLGTVLPARFGTVLEHEDAARTFLDTHHAELGRGLGRVRGAVEMGVRAHFSPASPGVGIRQTGESGTSYMLSRLGQVRSARHIADQLAPLHALARRARVSVLPRDGVAVLAAYLIERSRAETFAEECRRLSREVSTAELICTGPWPPYSFVQGDGAQ